MNRYRVQLRRMVEWRGEIEINAATAAEAREKALAALANSDREIIHEGQASIPTAVAS
jgi:hypothetical protein